MRCFCRVYFGFLHISLIARLLRRERTAARRRSWNRSLVEEAAVDRPFLRALYSISSVARR